ncbi:hypothetical protein DYB26_011316 [Aphanomyces astaci]|uniref:Pentacotripeptide-repeat region of PRORP domain-containing protein n=1 Tax=Aphanomyces astaci TaxID=112090 RepID=A0A418CRS8_APHAT|nr:hypothetical protein DYB26_011316 [Aphanomyces astaci]
MQSRFESTAVANNTAALSIIESKLHRAEQAADWKHALGTFQHFATNHPTWVEPKHANIVLRACAAQGRHREAKKVLHILQGLGHMNHPSSSDNSASTSSSTQPALSVESQALMCQALAENGKGDEALVKAHALVAGIPTLDDNIRRTLSASLYRPLLKAFKLKNDWKHTLTLLKQMQEFSVPIPLRGYRLLLLTLSSGRQPKMLVDVARQVLSSSTLVLDVQTYTIMIKTLSACGEHGVVHEVLNKIRTTEAPDYMDTTADMNLYNAMIRAHMLAHNLDESRRLLWHLLTLPHLTPDAFCFTTCMLGYLRPDSDIGNGPNQVTSLYEDMNRRGISPSILTLACVLRAIHRLPTKKFLLSAVLAKCHDVPLGKPDFVHTLIDALDEVGQTETGEAVFRRAMDQQLLGEWRKGLFGLNLHTFSKGSAKTAVQFALTAIATQPKSYRETMGRGSKEFMKPVLKPEIEALLWSHFALRSHTPAQNHGCLVVQKEHLQQWLAKQQDKAAIRTRK